MKILGIDPGTATVGYGVIEKSGHKLQLCSYGIISTPAGQAGGLRLQTISLEIKKLLREHQPAAVGLEKLFFSKNVRTALSVAQARGVILEQIASADALLIELSPQQVKMAVTGYGKADKLQVQTMVKRLLNLSTLPKPDDAADALAAAIAAAVQLPAKKL